MIYLLISFIVFIIIIKLNDIRHKNNILTMFKHIKMFHKNIVPVIAEVQYNESRLFDIAIFFDTIQDEYIVNTQWLNYSKLYLKVWDKNEITYTKINHTEYCHLLLHKNKTLNILKDNIETMYRLTCNL